MKSIKLAVWATALCLSFAGDASALEEPAVIPDALLSVSIPDLHGFLDGVGEVAAQVSPMMDGTMLKNMIGAQVGVPGLMGIAPSNGLALVVLDPTNIFAVIELEEVYVASFYTNFVAPQQMEAQYVDGLMVIGKTKEQVIKGVGLADAVKSTLLAKPSPTLRISLQPASIVENNNDHIQEILAMMPSILGPSLMRSPGATLQSVESTTKLLVGELRLLLSLAAQCESAEEVLAPENGSIRFSETFVPKAGTRLEALCNAPAVNQPDPRIRSGYLGSNFISFESTVPNTDSLMAFVEAEAVQFSKEMEIPEAEIHAWLNTMNKWWMIFGGSFCETVNFEGGSGISVGYLMDLQEQSDALAVLKAMPQDMEPFLGLYEDMDMPMTMEFKEGVREYKGTKIHQFVMDMTLTNQSPEVLAQITSMNLTNMVYDIAITNGVMVFALGDENVETILDHLADDSFEPVPLKARGVYPADGLYYLDLDVEKYMAFIMKLLPDAEAPMLKQQLRSLFQEAEPITSAGFKANGCVMWSVNVPGELIAKFGQMAMMLQMQQKPVSPPMPAQ